MNKTIVSFKKDLGTLRTGRANPAMLDLIRVDVYGQKMPISQLATVTVPEPRTISIQVWDKNNVKLVDSEIQKSNLGVNPQVDGQTVRIHIPQLTEERRKELTKILKNLGEKGKVSIRNVRRECNDSIKKLLFSGVIIGFKPVINSKKIELDITAFITVYSESSKNFEKGV